MDMRYVFTITVSAESEADALKKLAAGHGRIVVVEETT